MLFVFLLAILCFALPALAAPVEGHKQWPTPPPVSPHKAWVVRFSQAVLPDTITADSLYVTKDNGQRVELPKPTLAPDGKTITIYPPSPGYDQC